jgi:outer membrane lipoprotein-sorting protein
VVVAGLVLAVTAQLSARQAAPAQGPQTTEQVFKNIKVLNGMPVDTFFDVMGMFAASMGDDCTFCHTKAAVFDHEKFGEATPLINRARQMIGMTQTINKTFFGGTPRITCFTCHRGNNKPTASPDFAVQYGPPVDDPSLMDFPPDDRIQATQVLDKYLEAIGGAAALAKLTSFTAKGTYSGFDTGHKEVPVDIYAKAPNQRTWIVHMPDGDSYRVFDGKNAWFAGPDSPAPIVTLTSGNLDRYRLEAMLAFPGTIKTAFSSWKVGRTAIDDNPVTIVQGSNPGGLLPVNFYFDNKSGLLVRMLRWNLTPLGPVPTQIDFDEYEEVAGVKMPMTWTASQTFMQMTIKLEDFQPNAAVPASRFVQPPPGKMPKP